MLLYTVKGLKENEDTWVEEGERIGRIGKKTGETIGTWISPGTDTVDMVL